MKAAAGDASAEGSAENKMHALPAESDIIAALEAYVTLIPGASESMGMAMHMATVVYMFTVIYMVMAMHMACGGTWPSIYIGPRPEHIALGALLPVPWRSLPFCYLEPSALARAHSRAHSHAPCSHTSTRSHAQTVF